MYFFSTFFHIKAERSEGVFFKLKNPIKNKVLMKQFSWTQFMFLKEKPLYGEQVVVQREGLLGLVLAKSQLSCVA